MIPAGVAVWARRDGVNGLIDRTLAREIPKAANIPLDQASAAQIDEELDYRMAERIRSLQAWRTFLRVTPMALTPDPRRRKSTGCSPRRDAS